MADPRGMRSRRPRKPQLGESWVVESDLDGEYEPSTSDSGEDSSTLPRNTSHLSQSQVTPLKNEPEEGANALPRSRRKSPERAETPRTRAAQKDSKATAEPDFIMPSIHNAHPSAAWTGDKRPRRKETPRRANNRRATFARSTRTEENGKDSAAYDWLEDVFGTILRLLRPMLGWTYDVAGTTFNTLKTPIALLIAVYILLGMSVFLRNLLTSSVYSAFVACLPNTGIVSSQPTHV